MYGWQLHHEPHRHYKRQKDDGKWTWEGRDRARIASVTDVLDAKDSLVGWAVNNTLVAAERAAVQWLDAAPALARSVVDFAGLTQLTGLMPDTIRDDKGEIGTLVHGYLADKLLVEAGMLSVPQVISPVPYGFRAAVDRFLAATGFAATADEHGPRVERAVGSYRLAVAGTYDAQGTALRELEPGVHRLDAKSSNTVQPKHFAQVAAYEELAKEAGEDPSDHLTIIHLSPLGTWTPYTIPAQGADARRALDMFHAYLTIHRSAPKLGKLLRQEN